MDNFVFQNPVKIIFGKGQIANLGREIPSGAKVLVTYGGGSIKANGVYAQVAEALDTAKLEWVEFGGIEANPRYETLMKAVDLARSKGTDFILAVGGGSVIDGSKFIAAAIGFDGDAWDILAKRARIRSAVPLGTILTLPATGSEMNAFSVVSREETGEKLGFGNPKVMPKFSVLDPETTYSLPMRQVGNGLVDAFVHVLEQYLTYPTGAVLQDRLAESVLASLVEIAPRVMGETPDYEARANLMWCATMALNGLIGQGVPQDWSTHMIGHELTALYEIDHARTLAAVWPALAQVQRQTKRGKLLQYAARVWNITDGEEDARIDQAIAKTRAFFESVGVPADLRSYGNVSADVGEIVANRLSQRNGLPLGELGDLDADAVKRILAKAMGA